MSSNGDLRDKPGAWVDLGLTLPIFVAYHAGVIFLRVQNATDPITGPMLRLSEGNRAVYLLITASVGVVFAGVFGLVGRGEAFRPRKFVQIALEGVLYAILMRVGAAYVVGRLFAAIGSKGVAAAGAAGAAAKLGAGVATGVAAGGGAIAPAAAAHPNPFVGLVMSLGAGFYEELAFRVLLFGLGTKILVWLFAHQQYVVVGNGVVGTGPRRLSWRGVLVAVLWALAAGAIFSGVHYVGSLGDAFALDSFVFRLVLGLVLTLIFVLRGFAAAVWAHALYDIWVLVLPGA